MLVEKPVKRGTVIIEKLDNRDEEKRFVEWTFVKQYKHHALFVNKKGIRRCFTNAELYGRGLVIPKIKG